MRRLPFVGFVVSAVAHVVAVVLLILVVERLTALPGLFIDLTTHATESRSASRPGGESPNERKLPTAPAKRSPEPPPGPSRARTGDSASPRTVVSPEPLEIADRAAANHSEPPIAANSAVHSPAPTSIAPSAVAPPAPRSVDPPTPVVAPTSTDGLPSASTMASSTVDSSRSITGSPGTSPVGAGRGSGETATVANGVSGGGGVAARPGQGLALATPGAGGGTGGAGPGGGPPAEYAEYLAQLRQRIQESLRYPLTARRRGLSGTVRLQMTIQPDGAIASVRIVESSSHSALDDAALEAVRSLRPMPFPVGVPRRELYVRVPVIFELPEFGRR